MRNRITYFHFLRGFDTRDDIAHIPRTQLRTWHHFHFEHSDFIRIIFLACIEEFHFIPFTNHTVHYLEICNDTTERIEDRIENQRLQRSFLVTLRMRDTLNDRSQNLFHSHACFAGSTDNFITLAAQQFDDLILHFLGHGACHVTFVDDGDNLQIMLNRHIEV